MLHFLLIRWMDDPPSSYRCWVENKDGWGWGGIWPDLLIYPRIYMTRSSSSLDLLNNVKLLGNNVWVSCEGRLDHQENPEYIGSQLSNYTLSRELCFTKNGKVKKFKLCHLFLLPLSSHTAALLRSPRQTGLRVSERKYFKSGQIFMIILALSHLSCIAKVP